MENADSFQVFAPLPDPHALLTNQLDATLEPAPSLPPIALERTDAPSRLPSSVKRPEFVLKPTKNALMLRTTTLSPTIALSSIPTDAHQLVLNPSVLSSSSIAPSPTVTALILSSVEMAHALKTPRSAKSPISAPLVLDALTIHALPAGIFARPSTVALLINPIDAVMELAEPFPSIPRLEKESDANLMLSALSTDHSYALMELVSETESTVESFILAPGASVSELLTETAQTTRLSSSKSSFAQSPLQ
jgi:hypothetical protein